jgi:hypothetical protein
MIDPTGSSLNIQDDLRNQLKAILPQAFSDNNLDFEKLKQLLGDDFTSPREERYGISWAGKTDAFRELQQTTTNTLSPDSTSNNDFLLPNEDSSVGERIGLPKQPNPRRNLHRRRKPRSAESATKKLLRQSKNDIY